MIVRKVKVDFMCKSDSKDLEGVESYPWEKSRGVCTFDYNNSLVLVKAPVAKVSQAFLEKNTGAMWKPNALGQEVELMERNFLIFRLKGHSWSEILTEHSANFLPPILESISRKLKCSLIFLGISDACMGVGYEFYESGGLMEKFEALDFDGEPRTFESKVRQIKPEEIKDICGFAQEFLKDHDAFDPGIYFNYFLGDLKYEAGDKAFLQNPGFMEDEKTIPNMPPIERLDFIGLKKGHWIEKEEKSPQDP